MALEDAPHPFTSFNKQQETSTLIGNWVEERSLKEATGSSRYEPWVTKDEDPTSLFPTRQDLTASNSLNTHPRVVEHLSQVAPQNWRTMYGASYKAPGQAPELIDYKPANTLGPRARMELEAMKAIAADLPPEPHTSITCQGVTMAAETTYSADFIPQDMTANRIGARCMRDHEGRPAVRDPTFLAETQLVPRHMGDRLFGESARLAGATQTMSLMNPEIPVTIYTEAVATRKYGGNISGTRPIAGSLPFNKFTNFSKPMSEYSKVVVDE